MAFPSSREWPCLCKPFFLEQIPVLTYIIDRRGYHLLIDALRGPLYIIKFVEVIVGTIAPPFFTIAPLPAHIRVRGRAVPAARREGSRARGGRPSEPQREGKCCFWHEVTVHKSAMPSSRAAGRAEEARPRRPARLSLPPPDEEDRPAATATKKRRKKKAAAAGAPARQLREAPRPRALYSPSAYAGPARAPRPRQAAGGAPRTPLQRALAKIKTVLQRCRQEQTAIEAS